MPPDRGRCCRRFVFLPFSDRGRSRFPLGCQGEYEPDRDADPSGFDAVDQRSRLPRHIEGTRHSRASNGHSMALGTTEWIGETCVSTRPGMTRQVGRVDNEIG